MDHEPARTGPTGVVAEVRSGDAIVLKGGQVVRLAGVEAPKAAPRQVADAILDGVQGDVLEIFPDPMAQQMAQLRLADPKAFEQAFLDLAAAQ